MRTTTLGPPIVARWTPGSVTIAATPPSAVHRWTSSIVGSSRGLAWNTTAEPRIAATDLTCRSGGVTGSPSTRSRRAPSRSAHVTSRPSSSCPGTPGTSSTHASSMSTQRSNDSPVTPSASSTTTVRWSRLCRVTSSRRASIHETLARYGYASWSQSMATDPPSSASTWSSTDAFGAPGGRVPMLCRRVLGMGRVGNPPERHGAFVHAARRDPLSVRRPPEPATATDLLGGDELGGAPSDALLAGELPALPIELGDPEAVPAHVGDAPGTGGRLRPRVEHRPGDGELARRCAHQPGHEQPAVQRECGDRDVAIGGVPDDAAGALPSAFAPGALLRREVALAGLRQQHPRVGDEPFLAGVGVEHPQAVDRIAAAARPGEHDPAAIGRHGDVARLAEGESLRPGVLARERVVRCHGPVVRLLRLRAVVRLCVSFMSFMSAPRGSWRGRRAGRGRRRPGGCPRRPRCR